MHTLSCIPSRTAFAMLREARRPQFSSRGYCWVCYSLRPAASQPWVCDPEHSGSASAGHLAVSRREPRFPFTQLLFGVNSFHFTRKSVAS